MDPLLTQADFCPVRIYSSPFRTARTLGAHLGLVNLGSVPKIQSDPWSGSVMAQQPMISPLVSSQ